MTFKLVSLLLLVVLNVIVQPVQVSAINATLAGIIDDILNDCSSSGCFGATWGIVVNQFDSQSNQFQELYTLNPLTTLTPASNTKLLTTSTALLTLGEQFVIRTPFYTDAAYQPGQPINTLCVRGMGDPSITMKQIEAAADFFGGATSIKNLVLDNSYYYVAGDPIPPAWEWEDITSDYGAIPTPLIINENTITITVYPGDQVGDAPTVTYDYDVNADYLQVAVGGATTVDINSPAVNTLEYNYQITNIYSVNLVGGIGINQTDGINFTIPILDTTNYFLNSFSQLLKQSSGGVAKPSVLREGQCQPETMYPSYVLESDYLYQLLNWTLQQSDNLYAESFLRILGAMFNMTVPPSELPTPTYIQGLNYVKQLQSDLGVSPDLYDQADGSGLSRDNYITPTAIINCVQGMFYQGGDPNRDFISMLPVAGETGTLSNRFIGTPSQGIVHAKTGSMMGVDSLSGVIAPNGIMNTNNPIFFSIIVNNGDWMTDGHLIPTIDSIVGQLTLLALSTNK